MLINPISIFFNPNYMTCFTFVARKKTHIGVYMYL